MKKTDIDFLHFGIKTVDLQHQKFFYLLNEIKMYTLTGEDNTTILEIIDQLKAYTQYHFETENRIMTRIGFPDIDEHLKQHDLFINKIEEFRITYTYKSETLSLQMLSFLQKWFLVHIPEYDNQYVECIKLKNKSIT